MQTQTWNRFEVQLPVRAGMQQLYDAWTTRSGIEKWFLRSSVFISPEGKQRHADERAGQGDTYTWMWHGYDDKVKEQRTILQANGKDFLQFEFSGDCLVTVKLKEEKDYVRVMLTQERIPADDNPATNLFVGCQIGWSFYMVNLKSIMEGGIDLRTKDINIPRASMA
jgi:hypothetical protein